MKADKLIILGGGEEQVIEFGNEAILKVPQTLEDWYMVYAGWVMADNGFCAEEVVLHFQCKKYELNEDGDWEEM